MSKSKLTQAEAHEAFEYRDGLLYWKVDPNNVHTKPGDLVGAQESNGYRRLQYKNVKYRVHQIIYLMFHGHIPKEIDHKDGTIPQPDVKISTRLRYWKRETLRSIGLLPQLEGGAA